MYTLDVDLGGTGARLLPTPNLEGGGKCAPLYEPVPFYIKEKILVPKLLEVPLTTPP